MTGKEIKILMLRKDLKQRWLLQGLREKFPNLAATTLSAYLNDMNMMSNRPQRAEVLKEAERIVKEFNDEPDFN